MASIYAELFDEYKEELLGLFMGVGVGQLYRIEPSAAIAAAVIFIYLTIIRQNKYIILRK